MIEKVNPAHPDKVADRIAGAIVDLAYKQDENPKIAVEVLIGHGACHIIAESSVNIDKTEVCKVVHRITNDNTIIVDYKRVRQDIHLARNQSRKIRCGDNGIFKGMPLTNEQKTLSSIARMLYERFNADGKYILDDAGQKLIVCQSNAMEEDILDLIANSRKSVVVNPLGPWTGGTKVDSGATNRKLGSDMADSVTGGGLHGKDLSKADVSVNIYAFIKAQNENKPIELCCAIGDETIDGRPYSDIVRIAKDFITTTGGFEKFAEWGLY